ncbi:MAG: fasciclin domain-containing protein [Bacteroidaceae bacterium]|nr:fasciclin domain-containing protein [Bacteroidaceae bacterium]
MKKSLFLAILLLFLYSSCTEQVDTSSRYVFTNNTVTSYLEKFEQYSEYYRLLGKKPVSSVSGTNLRQLLSARGHYTVFAPTNDAIQAYLDTLVSQGVIDYPSWDAFTDSTKLDSIERVIVYNSIIDCGDHDDPLHTWDFPTQSGFEMVRANMNDRKLSVYYTSEPNDILINGLYPIDHKNRDILLLNGVLHQMEQVVAPRSITANAYLWEIISEQREGYLVMARAISACGLMDTLSAWRDENYETLYQRGLITNLPNINALGFADGGIATAPRHRLFGFTIFAETDEFWRSQGIDPADPDLLPKLQKWIQEQGLYSEDDVFTTGRDYTSPDNLLNLFVTYHILPMRIPSDKLVIHHNESRFSLNNPDKIGMACEELYTTMGKRRLLKIYESKESQGVYLNRFPVLDNGRHGSGGELSCDEDKVGCRVGRDLDEAVLSDIINAVIYPLDKPLAYTDDVRDNLHKQRLRFDALGMLPESMTNDIRKRASEDIASQQVYIPKQSICQYFNDMWMNDDCNMVYFNAYRYTWPGKNGDEMKAVGRYEVTYRLPPVPRRGVYELRYAIISTDRRGVAQVYFGSDFDRLPVAGIPMDWTIPPQNPITAWEADTEDDDYNNEIDKRMRNNGYMNGDKSNCVLGNPNSSLREYTWAMRRILLRQYMDPDLTYYIRMKSVLDTDAKEFYMDYIELCPKEVYDNPERPEDIW